MRLIDLVTHAAGLPRELPRRQLPGNDPDAQVTAQDFAKWLGNNHLIFKPGKSVHYSNFGFDLLALSLSMAANKSFPVLVQRQITEPLNMKDTVFVLSGDQRQRLMQGHGFEGEVLPDISCGSVTGASGALYSTPNDLLKWMQWHLDRFG